MKANRKRGRPIGTMKYPQDKPTLAAMADHVVQTGVEPKQFASLARPFITKAGYDAMTDRRSHEDRLRRAFNRNRKALIEDARQRLSRARPVSTSSSDMAETVRWVADTIGSNVQSILAATDPIWAEMEERMKMSSAYGHGLHVPALNDTLAMLDRIKGMSSAYGQGVEALALQAAGASATAAFATHHVQGIIESSLAGLTAAEHQAQDAIGALKAAGMMGAGGFAELEGMAKKMADAMRISGLTGGGHIALQGKAPWDRSGSGR